MVYFLTEVFIHSRTLKENICNKIGSSLMQLLVTEREKSTHFRAQIIFFLDGLDLEVQPDEGEHQALQVLDQVVEAPEDEKTRSENGLL